MSQDLPPLNLTLEDGRKALGVHALEKGHQLYKKYGKISDYSMLLIVLKDEEFVRHPTRIEFSSSNIEAGSFGFAERISKDSSDGYVIYIHEYFKNQGEDLPALVLYQLMAVNYGEFATYNEAEEFASAALGMDKEKYYQYICRLTDLIPK